MPDPLHVRTFELARQHGTPLLVFSPERLDAAVDRLRTFTDALPLPTEVYYSYKTNYLPALCEQLAGHGVGAEVTSPLEWELATRLHPPPRIVVNGIGKTAGRFLLSMLDGQPPHLVNLETDTEIELMREGPSGAEPIRVGLRVCIPSISGERGSDPSERWRRGTAKFGWTADGHAVVSAAQAIAASRSARLDALHLHTGSQVVSASFYDDVLRNTCHLLVRLRAAGVPPLSTLDLGGGLASGWVDKRRTGPLFELLHTLRCPVQARTQREPDLDGIARVFRNYEDRLTALGISRLIFEPGRLLAEPSMAAVGTVIGVRRDGQRRHAVLDIGTNTLHCWRSNETRPVIFDRPTGADTATFELVGPLCHRSDTFGTVTAPADLAPGDLVCLDAVGAYSVGDWIANTWHRPPVVHTDGRLLWRRQTTADFLAPALTPDGAGHD